MECEWKLFLSFYGRVSCAPHADVLSCCFKVLETKQNEKKRNDTRHFPSPQRNCIFPGLMEVKFFFRAFFEHSREIFNNSQARYKKFHSNVQKKLSKKI